MESFFALVQKNFLNLRRWTSRDQLRPAIVTWIEASYHLTNANVASGN